MSDTSFLGLRTVIYKVTNLNEATTWYSKILDKDPYFEEPFYVGFNVSGYELGLLPSTNNEAAPTTVQPQIYWGVNDINATFERLKKLGAQVHEEPENVGGDIMVATVKDPWNNIFGIIYNPDFKAE